MAGGSYQGEDSTIADINVTPLVDVVLVLLVIFMVTAPMIAARGILVNSPKTVEGDAVKSPLKITIAPVGEGEERVYDIWVNDTRLPPERRDELFPAIEQYFVADPEVKAVIAADTTVPHGEVMSVIDVVKRTGISKFALASEPKREKKAP